MAGLSGPARAMRAEARSVSDSITRAFTGAGRERDLVIQSLKAAFAAIVAWAISGWWLQDPMGMMAPWVAILLVQGTVFRSVLKGVQQLAAILIGTLLGAGAMMLTGDTLAALAIVLPVMMLLSNWSWFGDQGIAGPTTALLVLTSGSVSDTTVGHRLLQCGLGAVIGIAVNALILPPVHLRNVSESLCNLASGTADTLEAIAEKLGEEEWDDHTVSKWRHRAHGLEKKLGALRDARQWSSESKRMNPKLRRRLHRDIPHTPSSEVDQHWVRIVGCVTSVVRILEDVAGEDSRTPAPTRAALHEYGDLLNRLAGACRAQGVVLNKGGADQQAGERDKALEEAERLEDELHEKLQSRDGSLTSIAALGTLLIQARVIRGEVCHEVGDQAEEEAEQAQNAGAREDLGGHGRDGERREAGDATAGGSDGERREGRGRSDEEGRDRSDEAADTDTTGSDEPADDATGTSDASRVPSATGVSRADDGEQRVP